MLKRLTVDTLPNQDGVETDPQTHIYRASIIPYKMSGPFREYLLFLDAEHREMCDGGGHVTPGVPVVYEAVRELWEESCGVIDLTPYQDQMGACTAYLYYPDPYTIVVEDDLGLAHETTTSPVYITHEDGTREEVLPHSKVPHRAAVFILFNLEAFQVNNLGDLPLVIRQMYEVTFQRVYAMGTDNVKMIENSFALGIPEENLRALISGAIFHSDFAEFMYQSDSTFRAKMRDVHADQIVRHHERHAIQRGRGFFRRSQEDRVAANRQWLIDRYIKVGPETRDLNREYYPTFWPFFEQFLRLAFQQSSPFA
jgi:hypothetical protein